MKFADNASVVLTQIMIKGDLHEDKGWFLAFEQCFGIER